MLPSSWWYSYGFFILRCIALLYSSDLRSVSSWFESWGADAAIASTNTLLVLLLHCCTGSISVSGTFLSCCFKPKSLQFFSAPVFTGPLVEQFLDPMVCVTTASWWIQWRSKEIAGVTSSLQTTGDIICSEFCDLYVPQSSSGFRGTRHQSLTGN